MISRWMMMAELRSAVVTPLLTEWELPSTALWAVFPAGRLPTTKARAFVNWFETGMVT
jgi:DNA-binding transcriptional LysR family regulator